MGKEKYLLVLVMILLSSLFINARSIRHMSMIIDEEKVDGISFLHTLKSDQGKVAETFLIDGQPVDKSDYYHQLDQAYLKEMQKKREQNEYKSRLKVEFASKAHCAILNKVVVELLQKVSSLINRLRHDELKPYYVFDQDTVSSLSELLEIKQLVSQAQLDVSDLVSSNDMAALQDIIDKLESWQDKLEECFKNSVNNAIEQSDDTLMLKELLSVVSAEGFEN